MSVLGVLGRVRTAWGRGPVRSLQRCSTSPQATDRRDRRTRSHADSVCIGPVSHASPLPEVWPRSYNQPSLWTYRVFGGWGPFVPGACGLHVERANSRLGSVWGHRGSRRHCAVRTVARSGSACSRHLDERLRCRVQIDRPAAVWRRKIVSDSADREAIECQLNASPSPLMLRSRHAAWESDPG